MCFSNHRYERVLPEVSGDPEQGIHSGNPPSSSLARSPFCMFSQHTKRTLATIGCVAGAFSLGALFYALLRHVKETPLEIAAGAGAVVFFMTLAALCVWKRLYTPISEAGPDSTGTPQTFYQFLCNS